MPIDDPTREVQLAAQDRPAACNISIAPIGLQGILRPPREDRGVVSRGGRPDMAQPVLEWNEKALEAIITHARRWFEPRLRMPE